VHGVPCFQTFVTRTLSPIPRGVYPAAGFHFLPSPCEASPIVSSFHTTHLLLSPLFSPVLSRPTCLVTPPFVARVIILMVDQGLNTISFMHDSVNSFFAAGPSSCPTLAFPLFHSTLDQHRWRLAHRALSVERSSQCFTVRAISSILFPPSWTHLKPYLSFRKLMSS